MATTGFLIISPETREELLAFEADPRKPSLVRALGGGDMIVPSDDCYLRKDGNYNIGEAVFQICAQNGYHLKTV